MMIIRNVIQTMSETYQYLIKALSILLVLVFYILFVLLSYYTLSVVLLYYHYTYKLILIDFLMLLGLLWLGFNILFNHFMCIMTEPGFPANLHSPQLFYIKKKCKKCGEHKPQRAHHCTLCNKCVLQMDHHCPWLYNCIGHFNRRYFVNFLTYTTVSLAILFLLNYPLIYSQYHAQYIYSVQLLVTILGGVLFLFSSFHWYLILAGKTTIEMFSQENYLKQYSYRQRIDVIYGTPNLAQVLLPSVRQLSHNGILWSQQSNVNQKIRISELVDEIPENLSN